MFRKISKLISTVLVFLLVLNTITTKGVFAGTNDKNNKTTISEKAKNYRTKNRARVTELKDKREQNTKYYLNSDGTTTAETYLNSVSYKDSEGNWQDISNKIVKSNEEGYDFKNEANSFETLFPKKSDSDCLAMLKVDSKHSFSWSLENANQVTASNGEYSVTYPEIVTNVDLQYQPFSDGLKENIILKNSQATNSFKFDLKLKGLLPVQQNDGSIALKDGITKQIYYVIPKPYMFDIKHQTSNLVTMVCEATKNTEVYTITVTADLKWMSDSTRAFPITIDPSALTQNYFTMVTSSGIDTYIADGVPNLQYYNSTYMTSGLDSSLGHTSSLVKFPINLPTGAIVTDALFSVYKYTTTASSETLLARRITSSWSNTVCWSNRPTVDSTYDQTEASTLNVSGSYIGYISFNVWSIVKGWVNGGLSNYGFQIDHNNANDTLFFYYASESPTGNGPCLSITYITDEIGLNPYWAYANASVGSVNTYNGNFITTTTDFSLPGRGIPINVSRTYNNRGNLSGLFGQKWFSNLDMHLEFPSGCIVLIDSTGAERPFMRKSDGVTYSAPDNYPVQIYQDTISGQTVYRVQQSNEETGSFQPQMGDLVFNGSGKLIQLDDGKGNISNITWNSGSVVVTDASGRTATLTLNGDGTVNKITSSVESGKIKASYTYSNGYLTSVTYDNGAYPSATINYEWNGVQLSSLTDKNGNKSYINYNSNNQVISVGPLNKLSNPSMEASPNSSLIDNWTPTIVNDSGAISQNSNNKFGRYSMNVHSITKSGTTSDSYLYSTQKVPVTANQLYTLSAYINTSSLGGSSSPNPSVAKAFLNVEQLDASNNHISWIDNRPNGISGTTPWTQSALNVTAASNAAYFIIYLEVQHDSAHFGGDAYFDGIQLERDGNATTFNGHTDFRYGIDGGFVATWVTSPTGELKEYKNDNYGTPVAVVTDPKDLSKPKSETDLVWNAADHLQSLMTPNQVNANSGKKYSYLYNPVGNMTSATDPLGRITSMDYYYSNLSKLTKADGSVVQNVWDCTNLNLNTNIDETLNAKAFTYDSGNPTIESNLLGVADNRILNSALEQLSGNQPINWYAYTPSGTVANQVEYQANAPYKDINGGSNILHINPGSNSYSYQWTDYIDLGGTTTENFNISAFIKTAQTGTTGGGCINVYWYDANKNLLGAVALFNARNTSWQQYHTTLQPPSGGAAYARVMAITYGRYDGYFDNIQFEKSQLFRGYNYIENSSFERGSLQWTAYDSNTSVIYDPNCYSGSYDAKISLASVGTTYLEDNAYIPVKPGQYYTLLSFMRTDYISPGSGGGGARIHVYFYDGNKNYFNDYVPQYVIGTTGWTKYVFPFAPPTNAAYVKIRVTVENSTGNAYFDNIRLSYGKLAVTNNYDSNKNYITSSTDQLSNTVSITSDAYGQPKQINTAGQSVTNFSYDGQERLRTVTDNGGSIATYNLDANGNVLNSSMKAGTTTYDSMSFNYDNNDNLTSVTDGNNNIKKLAYDEGGRLTQQVNPDLTTISNTYDNYGNLSKIALSNGGSTYNFSYDLEGRKTNSSVAGGGSTQYGYDAVGNLISHIEKDASSSSITTIGAPSSGSMYSNVNQLLGFNFTYKNNSFISYSFDYSKSGLLNSITDAGKKFSFSYDEGNNLISKLNPNNTLDNYAYNDAGQITGVQTIDNNSNVKWSSQYIYNSDGKVTQVTGSGPGSPTANYTYNNATEKLNRLTSATINDGANNYTFNYSYDPAGNLLTMDIPNGTTTPTHQTFTYDNDNRITSSGYLYDGSNGKSNGNLTNAIINGASYQYDYDAANRLTTVKDGSGTVIATYSYDGEGNRISKTVAGVTTNYHYFMGSLQYETLSSDPTNVIHAFYLRTPQGALEAVSLNYTVGSSSNTFYYYHYNKHGDIIAVTDSNGNLYRQYIYDPFGNVISTKDGNGNTINIKSDSGFNNAYLYAGYRYDQESGLYFLNARYYAPGIGRFLTKDSIVDNAAPQTLNLYAYVCGDPVNAYDPTGCEMEEAVDGGNINVVSVDNGKWTVDISDVISTGRSKVIDVSDGVGRRYKYTGSLGYCNYDRIVISKVNRSYGGRESGCNGYEIIATYEGDYCWDNPVANVLADMGFVGSIASQSEKVNKMKSSIKERITGEMDSRGINSKGMGKVLGIGILIYGVEEYSYNKGWTPQYEVVYSNFNN